MVEHCIQWFIDFNLIYMFRMIFVFSIMMTIYNKVNKDSIFWKIIKYPFEFGVAIFIIFDVLYNYIMSIYMLDAPRKWNETVSERLGRYKKTLKESKGLLNKFRYKTAKLFCAWLSMSDPNHCNKFAPK